MTNKAYAIKKYMTTCLQRVCAVYNYINLDTFFPSKIEYYMPFIPQDLHITMKIYFCVELQVVCRLNGVYFVRLASFRPLQ